MPEPLLPSVRKEVQDYLRACEHLLSVAMKSPTPRFSTDELELLEFYAAELAEKILIRQADK